MDKSNSIQNLAKALITFHLKVEKVKKDATNPFFKSKYATLSNILDSINTPLIESGLAFTQFPSNGHGLTTMLMHAESGEFLTAEYDMVPVKDDPQGRGSVLTYQRRYALAAVLGLNIDDDDDGNTATYGGSTPEQASRWREKEEDTRLWLNKTLKNGTLTTDWVNVTKALASGAYTISDVEKKFKVSKENKAELLTIQKQQL